MRTGFFFQARPSERPGRRTLAAACALIFKNRTRHEALKQRETRQGVVPAWKKKKEEEEEKEEEKREVLGLGCGGQFSSVQFIFYFGRASVKPGFVSRLKAWRLGRGRGRQKIKPVFPPPPPISKPRAERRANAY